MSTQNIENELHQIRVQLKRIADHLDPPEGKPAPSAYEESGVDFV